MLGAETASLLQVTVKGESMGRFVVVLVLAGTLCGCVTEPEPTVVTPGLARSQSPGTLFWYWWQSSALSPYSECDPVEVRVPAYRHRHHRHQRCDAHRS